jgi:hypothetical protein
MAFDIDVIVARASKGIVSGLERLAAGSLQAQRLPAGSRNVGE